MKVADLVLTPLCLLAAVGVSLGSPTPPHSGPKGSVISPANGFTIHNPSGQNYFDFRYKRTMPQDWAESAETTSFDVGLSITGDNGVHGTYELADGFGPAYGADPNSDTWGLTFWLPSYITENAFELSVVEHQTYYPNGKKNGNGIPNYFVSVVQDFNVIP